MPLDLLDSVLSDAEQFFAKVDEAIVGAKADASPKDLSDNAIRAQINILEKDIAAAARTPRANVSGLRKKLDDLEDELRSRTAKKDSTPGSTLDSLIRDAEQLFGRADAYEQGDCSN